MPTPDRSVGTEGQNDGGGPGDGRAAGGRTMNYTPKQLQIMTFIRDYRAENRTSI